MAIAGLLASFPLGLVVRAGIGIVLFVAVCVVTGLAALHRKRGEQDQPHLGIEETMLVSPTGVDLRGGNKEFLIRAKRAFLETHAAFGGDPSRDVMRHVSHIVFHHWSATTRPLATDTAQVRVSRMTLLHTGRDANEEIALVEFEGAVHLGHTRRKVRERWTFRRSMNAAPEHKHRLDAKQCPVCAKDLRIDRNGACVHCGSNLSVGDHDWAVVQIEPV